MQVLIVKTSSMGDVLHTLPALTDAMQAIPGIRFDWVVEESFSQIPTWHPAVDRVIPVAIRRWRKNWFGSETRQQRCDFKRVVQERNYDAVIDAQGLIKSAALITRIAKGSKHGQDSKAPVSPSPAGSTTTATISTNSNMPLSVRASCLPKAWAMKNPTASAITPLRPAFSAICRPMPASIWCFYMLPPAMRNTGRKHTGAI